MFYKLTRIHRSLDDAIAREAAGRLPSRLRLLRLRRLRLLVKNRLTALMSRPAAA